MVTEYFVDAYHFSWEGCQKPAYGILKFLTRCSMVETMKGF